MRIRSSGGRRGKRGNVRGGRLGLGCAEAGVYAISVEGGSQTDFKRPLDRVYWL
jgi:hypothetical protein